MSDYVARLTDAIAKTKVAEVVKGTETEDSVRLLCRVHKKDTWCKILEYILLRKKDWSEHICQQYFMRNGQLIYGWNVIINSTEIDKAVDSVCKLLQSALGSFRSRAKEKKQQVVSVDSMPLVGAGAHRTAKIVFDPRLPGPRHGGPSHKGAFTIGNE